MVDLSATGFGMISKHRYPVGKTLQAGLMHEGEALNGAMTVQSVRDLGPLGIRYGLRYSEAESTNSALRKGLQEVSRRVEREMLRRRSGL